MRIYPCVPYETLRNPCLYTRNGASDASIGALVYRLMSLPFGMLLLKKKTFIPAEMLMRVFPQASV